jgi:hypothetical protein
MTKSQSVSKSSGKKACEYTRESMLDELKVLHKEPSFVCKACERSSSRAEDLCQPERFFSAW